MKRLSEFTDDKALDLLCEIAEPISEIFSDEKVSKSMEKGSGKTVLDVVKLVIKEHRKAVISIMAAFNEVPYEDYHYNLVTLISDVMTLVNDKELTDFFTLQGQMNSNSSFGSVTANTEEGVQ